MSYYYNNRSELIKKILEGNNLNPLLDLDTNETEAFVNIKNEKDTRDVLNKKVLDFSKVINQIGGKLVYIKSGTTGHTFRGFDPNDLNSPNFAVKVAIPDNRWIKFSAVRSAVSKARAGP